MGSDNDETGGGNLFSSSEGVRVDGRSGESETREWDSSQKQLQHTVGYEISGESGVKKADEQSSAFLVDVRFSEHSKIEAKRYELSEFNTLIEELSHEWFDGKEKLIKKYGSIEKAMDNGDYSYVGYAKTAIRIDVPGFKEIDTRIDIGDFNTDLLGYLSNYSEYDEQVKVLKNYLIKKEQMSKEKNQGMFKRWRLQLPELINNLDSNSILHLSNNIVNKKDENVLNENIELLVADTKINNDIELLEADEIIEADEFDTPDKIVFEQMSLFDFAMSEAEQIGDIISAEATKPQINASSIFVSDELVKDIVASGANYEARYAIFYRITRPFDTREKMVDFVKQQYKGSIKGIILENGDKIALYADEDGLKIAHGTRARVKPERVVSYEEILDIATELVKEGKFISSTELPYAEEMELSHLAEDIVDIFWSSEAKNYFNDYFNEYRYGYPDLKDKIKESLINADDNLIELGDSLKKLFDDYTNGVIKLPWYKVNHYNNEYGNIFDRIALYNSEPIKYQLNDDLEVYKEAFITHDFIDKHITYSGVENGEFRIRKYFGENFTNIQEAAKYLAEEYGTSGRGVPGGNGYSLERRPGKGITISKGMVGQRDVEVKLKYTEVAKILKYL
ncbi:MAG: hypothetical protein J6A59_11660, partial [Lachnospiraceae bacterium]|nr:hypothetical protein [Lachnospiraceae bacterium]